MINEKIKKLVYYLLLAIFIYVGILILPFLIRIAKYIFTLLIPFLISFVLAFILQPIVEFFKQRGLKRSLAVLLVVTLFLSIIVLTITYSTPYLVREITVLIKNLPEITNELETIINNFAKKFTFLPEDYRPTFDNISYYLQTKLQGLSNIPMNFLNNIFRYLSILVTVPILTIYFLLDYEKIFCYIRNKLIEKDKIHFRNYLAELNRTMSSYFRGMFLVMFIFCLTASTLFLIIRLEFAVFFGIIIGVTNVIPYLGPYLGASFPVLYALTTSPRRAILVAILCYIMQFLETNFLTPFVQSKTLKIHPLLIILSLLVFGRLFGIIGLLLAVPLLSMILITLKYYPKRQNMSKDV